MEWNKKLYEHEIIPPEHVWNKIVHDLITECIVSRISCFMPKKPAEQLWSKITGDLDNEYIIFKDKLFNAEVTPPPPHGISRQYLMVIQPAKYL